MPKKKKFVLPLTAVVWDDAYSEDDWMSLEDVKKHEPCLNVSVGFLADDGDNHITLIMTSTPGSSPDRMVATRLTIPKPYVITMETLAGNGRWNKVIDNTKKKEDEDTTASV